MKEALINSVYFGMMISILSYGIGITLKRKLKFALFNPLLVSTAIIIIFL